MSVYFSLCDVGEYTKEFIEALVHESRPLWTASVIALIQQRESFSSLCLHLQQHLHVRRGGGTSNNLNELSSNDGLASTVVKNLVLANHLSSVLGSILGKQLVTVTTEEKGEAFCEMPWE